MKRGDVLRMREELATEVIRLWFCGSDRPKGELGEIVKLNLMDEVGLRIPLQGEISYFEEYPHGYSMAVNKVIYNGQEYRTEIYVNEGHPETDTAKLCREPVLAQAKGASGAKGAGVINC